MQGISSAAPLKIANNFKYNGKELNHGEFGDTLGLEWYNYGFRDYDAQIGRFPQLDPLTDDYPFLSACQYASNDPISNIDIDGLEGLNIIHSTGYMVNGVAFGVQGAEYAVIASKMTGSVLGVASSFGSVVGSGLSIGRGMGQMLSGPDPSLSLFDYSATPSTKSVNASISFWRDYYSGVDFERGQLLRERNGWWDALAGHRQDISGLYVDSRGYPLPPLEQISYAAIQRQAQADMASLSMLGGPLRMLGQQG